MNKRPRPHYTNPASTQTLEEGIQEYYLYNSDFTHPSKMPPDFAKIMYAHDASHVIYDCNTDMFDELKLLPLTFWTSDFKFADYLRERKNPAVDVMYKDLIQRYGLIWLYTSIFAVLPGLIPEIASMWRKTRKRQKFLPYLDFNPLLERSLLDIRQEFDLLQFIPSTVDS